MPAAKGPCVDSPAREAWLRLEPPEVTVVTMVRAFFHYIAMQHIAIMKVECCNRFHHKYKPRTTPMPFRFHTQVVVGVVVG